MAFLNCNLANESAKTAFIPAPMSPVTQCSMDFPPPAKLCLATIKVYPASLNAPS